MKWTVRDNTWSALDEKRVEKMKKYEKALDNLPMHVKRLQCHENMRNNNSITQQQT